MREVFQIYKEKIVFLANDLREIGFPLWGRENKKDWIPHLASHMKMNAGWVKDFKVKKKKILKILD